MPLEVIKNPHELQIEICKHKFESVQNLLHMLGEEIDEKINILKAHLDQKVSASAESVERYEQATDADIRSITESLNRLRVIINGNGTAGVYQRIDIAERDIKRLGKDMENVAIDIEKSAKALTDAIKTTQEGIQYINRWLIGIFGTVCVAAIIAAITWFSVNVIAH